VSSSASTPTAGSLKVEPFRGGGLWMALGALGAVFVLITVIVAMATDSRDAFYSYLVAFAYWCGIAFASVILLMCFHATRAQKYGHLLIEELIDPSAGENQSPESPATGLDAPKGAPARRPR